MDKFIGKKTKINSRRNKIYEKPIKKKKSTELVMKFFPTKDSSSAYGFPG